MIGDDLSGLFPGRGDDPFGFRQGVVLTFGLLDGTNTIDVGGTVLTNVPFLNPGGYTILAAGDVVVLIRMRSSWAILGRVTVPGGTRAIGRYTELSGTYSAPFASGFALTTSFVTAANLAITVPQWAEVATITATLMALALNTAAVDHFLYGQILVGGGSAAFPSATAPPSKWAQVTVLYHTQVAVVGGSTLSLQGQVRASAAWAANASNQAFLQATIAWNSNDG